MEIMLPESVTYNINLTKLNNLVWNKQQECRNNGDDDWHFILSKKLVKVMGT